MKTKMKSLVLAGLSIAVGTGVIVGTTYALFTSETTVNNHIVAGKLDVGLTLETLEVNGTDTLAEPVDLTDSPKSVFDIEGAVPTDVYTATIEISEGSANTIGFDYGLKFISDDESQDEENGWEDLLAQLSITITKSDGSKAKENVALSTVLNDENVIDMGTLEHDGAAQTFFIEIEFLDDEGDVDTAGFDNNDAQGQSLIFDIQVIATSKVYEAD